MEQPNNSGAADGREILVLSLRTFAAAERCRLLFIGRIDAFNKGLYLLVEAFGEIADRNNATLVIQGQNHGDRQALEDKAEQLGLRGRVCFREPDFTREATAIIVNYDVFCLPSRFEGFGLSALEAMIAGRVLLVSEVAGIAPHVKASGCGVVVDPERSAINTALEDLFRRRAEWQEMGMRGRRYALEHLQWSGIAAAAVAHYRCL